MIRDKRGALKDLKERLGMPLNEDSIYKESESINGFVTTFDVDQYGFKGKRMRYDGRMSKKEIDFLERLCRYISLNNGYELELLGYPRKLMIRDILKGVI